MPDGKILSEQNRAKLDGIVQKMIQNKESEESISFVVNDFKSKYGEKKKDGTNAPSSSSTIQKPISESETQTKNGSSGTPNQSKFRLAGEKQQLPKESGDLYTLKPNSTEVVQSVENTLNRPIIYDKEQKKILSDKDIELKSKELLDAVNTVSEDVAIQNLEDAKNDTQAIDYAREGGKKFVNVLSGIANIFPKGVKALTGGAIDLGEFDTFKPYVPLQEEKEEIKKANPKANYSEEELNSLAEKLFIEKDLDKQRATNANNILQNEDPRVQRVIKGDQIRKLDLKNPELESNIAQINIIDKSYEETVDELTQLENSIKEKQKNGIQLSQEEIDLYNQKLSETESLKSNYLKLLDKNDVLSKDISDTKKNIELFKLNYNPYDKFLRKTASSGEKLIGGAAALAGELLPNLPYNTEIKENLKQFGKETIEDAEKKESLYRRISVDDIQTTEDFGRYFADLVAEQIPVLASVSMGYGGLAFVGAGSGGQKTTQMRKELQSTPKKYSDAKIAITGLSYGLAEAIPEIQTLKIINGARRTLSSISTNAVERELFQNGLRQSFNQLFKGSAKVAKSGVLEGLSENATGIMQDYIDEKILGQKVTNKNQKRKEEFISGFVLGGGLTLLAEAPAFVSYVASQVSTEKEMSDVRDKLKKLTIFQKELEKPNLTETDKATIQQEIKSITTDIESTVKAKIKSIENLSKEQIEEVVKITTRQGELKNEAQDIKYGNLSDNIKKFKLEQLKSEFKSLEEKRNGISSGQISTIEVLPIKEQDKIKREALKELTSELNPDGKKDITITEAQIVERANSIYKEQQKEGEEDVLALLSEQEAATKPQPIEEEKAEIQIEPQVEQEVLETAPSSEIPQSIEAKKSEIAKLEKEKENLRGNRTEIKVGDTFNYNFGIARDGLVTVIKDNNDGTVQTKYADGTIKTERKSNLIDYLNEQNGVYNEVNMPDNTAKTIEINSKIDSLNKEIKSLEKSEKQETNNNSPQNETIEPIRQLGTGSNVYYENDNLRVNEGKDGEILLIVNDPNGGMSTGNYSFKSKEEAVSIAKKINALFPNGLNEKIVVSKLIENIKNGYYDEKLQEQQARADELLNKGVEDGRYLRQQRIDGGMDATKASELGYQEWLKTADGQEYLSITNQNETKPAESTLANGNVSVGTNVVEQSGVAEQENTQRSDAKNTNDGGNAKTEVKVSQEPTLEDISSFLTQTFKQNEKTNTRTENAGLQENSQVSENQEREKVRKISQRGKTPLDKRKIKDVEMITALNIEAYDPFSLVQKYFISGGRILTDDVKKLLGSGEEARLRQQYARTKEKKGATINQISHYLWEQYGEDLGLTTEDFRNAVEEVVSQFVSPKSIALDLNSRFGISYENQQDFDESQFYEEAKNLGIASEEEHNLALSYLDVMTDEEIMQLADEQISFEDFLANEETKSEKQKKKDKINSEVDKIADKIKNALPGIKDPDVKKQGLSQDAIIDLVAAAVKNLINSGIEIDEAIRQVVSSLKERFGDLGFDIDPNKVKSILNPPSNDFVREKGKKSLLTRVSTGADQTLKKAIEKYSLDYDIENQETAKENADKFVDEVGIEQALLAVRANQIVGAEKAFVYNKVIEEISNTIMNVSEDEAMELERINVEILGEIANEFDQESRNAGRFISALQKVYSGSQGRYNLSLQIQQYKAKNDGKIPDEILAKFKEADLKIKELEAKLQELEKTKKAQQTQRSIEEIIESISRKNKIDRSKGISSQTKAKELADKLRSYKIGKSGTAKSSLGVDVVYDAAIEIIALAIENAPNTKETIGQAIKKGIAYIRSQNLSQEEENQAVANVFNAFDQVESQSKGIKIDDNGKLKIPHSIIREKVEGGIKNVEDLVDSIKKDLDEIYPDNEFTDREVRDAITDYGKISNPTKDEIEIEISVMKSLGKLISGLEDAYSGKRPLRSGLQRRKPTLEERAKTRKLKELLRDLPMDDADLQRTWKTALDAIKTRLSNEIADLDKQIQDGEKRKPERKTIEYDEEAKALKSVRDQKKQTLDELVGKPELTEEERIEKATILTQKSIDALQEMIVNGEIDYKTKPTPVTSAKLEAMRAHKRQLQKQIEDMRKEAGLAEMKRLEIAKKTRLSRIEELKRRIREKDYSVREQKPLPVDEELLDIERQLQEQKAIYEKEKHIQEMNDRSLFRKWVSRFVQFLGITRLFKAGGEFSQVLVQQGFVTPEFIVYAPKEFFSAYKNEGSAKKALMNVTFLRAMYRLGNAFVSPEAAKRYEAEMKSNPNYPLMQKVKLSLTGTDHKLDAQEENYQIDMVTDSWNFIGDFIDKVTKKRDFPTLVGLIKKIIGKELKESDKKTLGTQFKEASLWKMFERGAVTYSNYTKMIKFNQGITELQKDLKDPINNIEDYKKVANYINVFSGRANLGKAEMISKDAALFVFSLRNAVSQFQQLNPVYYLGTLGDFSQIKTAKDLTKIRPTVAQKMAIKSFMTSFTAIVAFKLAFMAWANAGEDDEEKKWKFETDPRSSDFGKLRKGKTTYDLWHGLNGLFVLYARIFTQQTKSTKSGEIKELGVGYGTPTTSELIGRYATNKLSPTAGYVYRLGNTHEEVDPSTGEKYRVDKYGNVYGEKEMRDLFVPIYWNAVNEIQKEDPDIYQDFLTSVGLLGMSVGVDPKGEKFKDIVGDTSGKIERPERPSRPTGF